jgi:hypothetical protein
MNWTGKVLPTAGGWRATLTSDNSEVYPIVREHADKETAIANAKAEADLVAAAVKETETISYESGE